MSKAKCDRCKVNWVENYGYSGLRFCSTCLSFIKMKEYAFDDYCNATSEKRRKQALKEWNYIKETFRLKYGHDFVNHLIYTEER